MERWAIKLKSSYKRKLCDDLEWTESTVSTEESVDKVAILNAPNEGTKSSLLAMVRLENPSFTGKG